MFNHEAYQKEYKQLRGTIDRLPHEYSSDLRIMLINLDQLVLHLSLEEVRCRQKRRVSSDYQALVNKITEHKTLLEEQLVLACLMS